MRRKLLKERKALKEGCSKKSSKRRVARVLKEGTSNFYSSDIFPLLAFELWDDVMQYAQDYKDYPNREDFETDDDYYNAVEEFEQKVIDNASYQILTDDEWIYLGDDIYEFNRETMKIADDLYSEGNDDDYWSLKEIKIEVKSGYYEGIQLYVKDESEFAYLSEDVAKEQYKRFNDFLNEMKKKYHLTQLSETARFSNGETWYSIVNEGLSKKSSKHKVARTLKEASAPEGFPVFDIPKGETAKVFMTYLRDNKYLFEPISDGKYLHITVFEYEDELTKIKEFFNSLNDMNATEVKKYLKRYEERNTSKLPHYYDLEDVIFRWHGEWADPELEYNNKLYNCNDVEEWLWNDFEEAIKSGDFTLKNGEDKEDAFDRFITNNKYLIYDALDGLDPVEELEESKCSKRANGTRKSKKRSALIRNNANLKKETLLKTPTPKKDKNTPIDKKVTPVKKNKHLKEGYIGQTVEDFLDSYNDTFETIIIDNVNDEDDHYEGLIMDMPDSLLEADFNDFDCTDLTINVSSTNEGTDSYYERVTDFLDDWNTDDIFKVWSNDESKIIFEGTKDELPDEIADLNFISFECSDLLINASVEDEDYDDDMDWE